MRLRTLLETPALGLRLLGGESEVDRSVRGVMTTDLHDPSRYLSGGELVLTGLAWRRGPEDSEPFVRLLAAAGVAGLAAGEAELGAVPEDMVTACARHRLPLFAVDESVAFATITEHVVRQVSAERAGDLAAVVDRHRRLMSSGPAGGGPEVVLDLLVSDLDLRAWVLTPTGRQVAGSAGTPGERQDSGVPETGRSGTAEAAHGTTLPAAVRARLAGEHLAAVRTERRSPHRVLVDGTAYALFPIRSGGRDLRETLLSDWLLAVEADAADWPAERLDLLHGVTQLIAVEREQRDAGRTVRRRLAQEVLELMQTGAAPAEIAARLRVAAPVLLPGLGMAPHWQVVVARVEWERPGPGTGTGTGTGGRDGEEIDGGAVAQSLLEEMLLDPRTSGAESADRVAVAHTAGEAVALVPLPAVPEGGTGADGREGPESGTGSGGGNSGAGEEEAAAGDPDAAPETGLQSDRLLAEVREPMARGLADDGRLTLGVSAMVHSAEGLRGALEEARHARRVAAARPGSVCAAGHEELASHVLLLPFVPDDVRRAFTARLLDPLRTYDRRHRAELLPTLEAFLAADGSWTRCAARLHLHVNTLRYRVGRIEQLTGRDLSRLEDKLDFFLALRMS